MLTRNSSEGGRSERGQRYEIGRYDPVSSPGRGEDQESSHFNYGDAKDGETRLG